MKQDRFYDVDYLSVKRRLKEYLAEQTVFKDYNFEGSAISMWLHFVAYAIVYINTILNFFANEMFIDSARIDENVLKHAYQKNYLPKRKHAPNVTVTIENQNTIDEIVIPKGSKFTMGGVKLTNIETISIDPQQTVEVILYQGEYVNVQHIFQDTYNETIRLEHREHVAQNYFHVTINGVKWISVFEDQNFHGSNIFFIKYIRNFDIRFDDGELFNRPNEGDIINVDYIRTDGAAYNNTSFTGLIGVDIVESNQLEIRAIGLLKDGKQEEAFDLIAYRAPLNYATAGRISIEQDYQYKIKECPVAFKFFDMSVYSSHRDAVTKEHQIPVQAFDSEEYKRDLGFYVYSAMKRTLQNFTPVYDSIITSDYTIDKIDDNEYKAIVDYLEKYRHMQTFDKYKAPSVLQVYPIIRIKTLGGFSVDTYTFEKGIFDYVENNHVGFNKIISKSDLIAHIKQSAFVDYVDLTFRGIIRPFPAPMLIYVESIFGFEKYEEVRNNAETFRGKVLEIWEEKKTLVVLRTTDAYVAPSELNGQESGASSDVTLIFNKRISRLYKSIKEDSMNGEIREGVSINDDSGDIVEGANVIGDVDYETGYITLEDEFNYATDEPHLEFEFEDDIEIHATKELMLDHKKAEVEYL